MKKLLLILIVIIFTAGTSAAKTVEGEINNIIKKLSIPKGAISLSFKNVKTGKTELEINSKVQVSPASTQKLLTFFPSYETLGEDYRFTTALYKDRNGSYYIKLGADPYLVRDELNRIVSFITTDENREVKNLYIDDSAIDNKMWGEGWQWDDDLNYLMPKFNSYNIDKNLYEIIVEPTKINTPANIFTEVFYPTIFINKTITSKYNTNITLSRDNFIAPDSLTVAGEVAKTYKVNVPVNHLRRYFILRLEEALKDNRISYYGKFERAKTPQNAQLVAQISHPIEMAATDILKNSNNLVSETTFKLAGGKYTKNTGTETSAIAMFNNYCNKNGLDCSNIRLTDGSGVSKNNLVYADFMSQYLTTIYKKYGSEKLNELLATSGEGTLKYRAYALKDKLHAKTGTLSNISAIAGYLETKKGNTYAFSIFVIDGKSKENDKKLLEELILKEVYEKL